MVILVHTGTHTLHATGLPEMIASEVSGLLGFFFSYFSAPPPFLTLFFLSSSHLLLAFPSLPHRLFPPLALLHMLATRPPGYGGGSSERRREEFAFNDIKQGFYDQSEGLYDD